MRTLEDCRAADSTDLLASRREFFDLPPDLIYLDGNSLGPPSHIVRNAVDHLLEVWRGRLIDGWWEGGWVDLPRRVGSRLEPIIGAEPESVVCSDSTTVNLYKVVAAIGDISAGDILTDSGNFPSDLYVLASIARQWDRRLRIVEPAQVLDELDGKVGLVSLTQVDFRTGRLHDMAAISRRAIDVGARSVWDLSHSAGVIPIDVAGCRIDAAVGCGYKYLNGGPGSPSFLYMPPNVIDEVSNPINGWFSHRAPFDFSPAYSAAEGIDRMQVGTPHILSMTAFHEALKAYEGVNIDEIRTKSVRLTSLFIELIDREVGCEVLTPRLPAERGSQVSLLVPQAEKLITSLKEAGIIADFRPPDVARFGFSPLYTGYEEVWRAVAAIKEVLSRI